MGAIRVHASFCMVWSGLLSACMLRLCSCTSLVAREAEPTCQHHGKATTSSSLIQMSRQVQRNATSHFSSPDEKTVPLMVLLERAAADRSILQNILTDLGGNSSHGVEELQAGLASMHQRRSGRLSLLQNKNSYTQRVAQEAVDKHVGYDHLLGGLATGTGSLIAGSVQGKPISEKDIFKTALPAMATVAGMASPVMGVVATFGVALIGGFLGDAGGDDSLTGMLEEFKEKIMEEVRSMVDMKLQQQAVNEIQDQLIDLVAEMEWVPEMLSSTDAAQAKVAYYLMFQSHLASMKSRIFKRHCLKKAMQHCSFASCPKHPELDYDHHLKSYMWNVGKWGFDKEAECLEWAKTGVPSNLGMVLSLVHLDTLQKIWDSDAGLRPSLQERMKFQIAEYSKIMAAYYGAMGKANAPNYYAFGKELEKWTADMVLRAPETSIWKGCVEGLDVSHHTIGTRDSSTGCRRRRQLGGIHAKYIKCVARSRHRRLSDVSISESGAMQCKMKCRKYGYKVFGMECPMGTKVHCQCGWSDIPGQLKSSAYCEGRGNPLVHHHSHCTGPYKKDGFLFGDFWVSSVYSTEDV